MWDPIWKITKGKWSGGVAQVVEYLPSKCNTRVQTPVKEGRKGGKEGGKELKLKFLSFPCATDMWWDTLRILSGSRKLQLQVSHTIDDGVKADLQHSGLLSQDIQSVRCNKSVCVCACVCVCVRACVCVCVRVCVLLGIKPRTAFVLAKPSICQLSCILNSGNTFLSNDIFSL
jgi:hypothetical protein